MINYCIMVWRRISWLNCTEIGIKNCNYWLGTLCHWFSLGLAKKSSRIQWNLIFFFLALSEWQRGPTSWKIAKFRRLPDLYIHLVLFCFLWPNLYSFSYLSFLVSLTISILSLSETLNCSKRRLSLRWKILSTVMLKWRDWNCMWLRLELVIS